jgi:Na+-translocating ferredoxin:NAD+ oxidoreductase RnfD subunit
VKFGQWIEKVAIPFIERWWRPLAIVVGVILAVVIGKRIIGGVVDAIFGKVTNGMPFTPVAGDPTRVTVNTQKGPVVVQLPQGVTSDKVTALGYAPGYVAKVEVASAATTRK